MFNKKKKKRIGLVGYGLLIPKKVGVPEVEVGFWPKSPAWESWELCQVLSPKVKKALAAEQLNWLLQAADAPPLHYSMFNLSCPKKNLWDSFAFKK